MEDSERVLSLIWKYAGFDGDHHKQWLLDKIVIHLTAGKSGDMADYLSWVDAYEENGQYEWNKGIAP